MTGMTIALTGTPGTGKTTVCEFIKEHSLYRAKYRIIDLHKLIMDEKLYTGRDESRDTYNADMERLRIRVTELIKQTPVGMDTILEGHISHYLPADVIIVLRASPVALRKRLGKGESIPMRRSRRTLTLRRWMLSLWNPWNQATGFLRSIPLT